MAGLAEERGVNDTLGFVYGAESKVSRLGILGSHPRMLDRLIILLPQQANLYCAN